MKLKTGKKVTLTNGKKYTLEKIIEGEDRDYLLLTKSKKDFRLLHFSIITCRIRPKMHCSIDIVAASMFDMRPSKPSFYRYSDINVCF